jgi:hypothetical protein
VPVGRGDLAGAIGHFRALLALNPGDNQGIRYRLLAALLEADLNHDAADLVGEYGDEPTAVWQYASVLLEFRAGDRRLARAQLRAALKFNRHMAKYLAGLRELPDELPAAYSIGSQDEAAIFASHVIDAGRRPQTRRVAAGLSAAERQGASRARLAVHRGTAAFHFAMSSR